MSTETTDATPDPDGRAMRRWRVALVIAGIALLALAGLVLVQDVRPTAWLGILLWFAGAMTASCTTTAPAVFVGAVLLRRIGRRIPAAVLGIVQGAVLVAALITALVVPEIVRQNAPRGNDTIVPLDYLAHLGLFSAGLAVATAAAIAVYLMRSRLKRRPRDAQV